MEEADGGVRVERKGEAHNPKSPVFNLNRRTYIHRTDGEFFFFFLASLIFFFLSNSAPPPLLPPPPPHPRPFLG